MDEEIIGFLEEEQIEGSLEEEQIGGVLEQAPVQLMVKDHNKLYNRDLENQHPISAITGLNQELLSIKHDVNENQLSIRRLETKIDNKVRTANEIPNDMEVGEYVFLVKGE